MVRSTLKPGPYEGQRVLDKDGNELGVVEGLDVSGTHIYAFRVKLDGEDTTRSVPRDWFLETVQEGLQLAVGGDEVRNLQRG